MKIAIDSKKFLRLIGVIILLIVSSYITVFIKGALSYISETLIILGAGAIIFDPLTFITYMLYHYFLVAYFQPRHEFKLFLFTIYLSLTTPLLDGVILLLTVYIIFRKFNLI